MTGSLQEIKVRPSVSIIAAAAALMSTSVGMAASPVTGDWLLQNRKAVVDVHMCGDSLCGRVSSIRIYPKDGARTDVHNRDASLRDRPLLGLPVLTGFQREADGWHGRIYDPKSGRTFTATLTQPTPNALTIKACVLFICKTQQWTRVR